MKHFFKQSQLFYLLLLIPFLNACNDDDDQGGPQIPPEDIYSNGVFVVNEGQFGTETSSLSFFDYETGGVEENVFQEVNNREVLGNTLQHYYIDGDNGYLVISSSAIIQKVNALTLEDQGTIMGDFDNPRYMTSIGNKGYITNFGTFVDGGFQGAKVSVVDLVSGEVLTELDGDNAPDYIMAHEGQIFISNTGNNTIGVIDPESDAYVTQIPVDGVPGKIVADQAGYLWVITAAFGAEGQETGLYRINPTNFEVDDVVAVEGAGKHLVINESKDIVYFVAGSEVFRKSTAGGQPEAITTLSGFSAYGLGIGKDDELFVGDATDFSSNGFVHRFSANGDFIEQFSAGIAPNGFIFRP